MFNLCNIITFIIDDEHSAKDPIYSSSSIFNINSKPAFKPPLEREFEAGIFLEDFLLCSVL